KEPRGERKKRWRGGGLAPAEPTAAIGEIVVDARGLKGRLGVAEQIGNGFRGLVRRLHADNEFEFLATRFIPGKAAFRLEKHWVDGLGLEFALKHQECRVVGCEFFTDLFALGLGF